MNVLLFHFGLYIQDHATSNTYVINEQEQCIIISGSNNSDSNNSMQNDLISGPD